MKQTFAGGDNNTSCAKVATDHNEHAYLAFPMVYSQHPSGEPSPTVHLREFQSRLLPPQDAAALLSDACLRI